jgi:hypothetical protein
MGAVGHQRREVHVFSDSKMLPLLFSVRIICTICSTMTGAMPSDLVSSTTQGYPSMCATVSICCSPPLMRAARRWVHRVGKQRKQALGRPYRHVGAIRLMTRALPADFGSPSPSGR